MFSSKLIRRVLMKIDLHDKEFENRLSSSLENDRGIGRNSNFYPQVTILLILICLLYGHVAANLVRQWITDPNYSHGFFVPLGCGLLLWTSRKSWMATPPRPSDSGLLFVVAAMGMLVVGTLGAEIFLPRASLVVLLGGLLVYFAGWRMLGVVRAPWLALFLMIPLPVIVFNEFAFPLQLLSSRLACALLDVLQIPVLREGNIIMLPFMSLDVVEACSGLRSLMSLITVAVLYSLFFERRTWMRCLLILLAVPVAVLVNALRIVLTALLARHVNAQFAEGFFHALSGLILFVLSFGVLAGFHALGVRFTRSRIAA
jgi:exosortase